MRTIELLSPAKNVQVGIAAINHGADAVYIGAPAFGARSSAANSLEDIATLIQYAHLFNVKVYVALNTILYDNEIDKAVELAHQLYHIGADALIIQDLGLLECDLPPIPLHASTQLNNRTPEKVSFLEKVGFSQVVLARELNLNQIREIKNTTSVPLEYFIHGALCVCYSGQCYMSEFASGRSGNRGECAQMCRHKYTLKGLDEEKEGYFLSTKDLSLGEHIADLIDAGISSFKIEGRLKDADYVKNVTAYFRKKIDDVIVTNPDLQRSSRGISLTSFTPNIQKTFCRGFTSYYIEKQRNDIANIRSPKSQGEYIGKTIDTQNQKILQRGKYTISIKTNVSLHNGDGLCFYDSNGDLMGIQVNAVQREQKNTVVAINKNVVIPAKTDIWRNYDIDFQRKLEQSNVLRKLPIVAYFKMNENSCSLTFEIEDGTSATIEQNFVEIAKNQQKQKDCIASQIAKLGDTNFVLKEIQFANTLLPFLPVSEINELRRKVSEELLKKLSLCKTQEKLLIKNNVPYPMTEPLDFRLNVANEKSRQFFARHCVEIQQLAFEKEHRLNVPLMTTKYCIRYQLRACKKGNAEPLYLSDKTHKFRVEFDCEKCEMNIFSTNE